MAKPLEIIQLSALSDNYMYLIHDPEKGVTAIIDPAEERPVLQALEHRAWKLDLILNTHHHWDHTGANIALKQKTGCQIIGAASDAERIPGIDLKIAEGDPVNIGSCQATTLSVLGHTTGHLAFWFEKENALFCGDSLFTLGCGRLFEGSAEQMWRSLDKIRKLPPETQIFCGHEYTEANARFALTVDPNNEDLKTRFEEIKEKRRQGKPTVPATLAQELKTNPFLRPEDTKIRKQIGTEGANASVFAELRRRKDNF